MFFRDLGLRPELLSAVEAAGYDTPTPIQSQAIPIVLAGRDLMGAAQTGTGKTAGFTLPLLQRLMEGHQPPPRSERTPLGRSPRGRGRKRRGPRGPWRPVRCLIVTPTRELAAQVEESVVTYGRNLPLTSTVIFGGVGMQPQIDSLRRGVDIVVATPGRLLDHAGRDNIDLSSVEILVLDEADRMLDMGFIHDIRKILKLLPEPRQNLLFSATIDKTVSNLAGSFLNDPEFIQVARQSTPAETVDHSLYQIPRLQKPAALIELIRRGDWSRVLVFTRTKHRANRIAKKLENAGIGASAIHGNKSQGARTRALADFKNGRIRALVATDIAARGLDIEGLPHVVNFELPNVPEDYVHRIGRTGRAGTRGDAISLVDHEEKKLLRAIERVIQAKIREERLEGFDPAATLAVKVPSRPAQGRTTQGAKPRTDRGSGPHSRTRPKRRRRKRSASRGAGPATQNAKETTEKAANPSSENRPPRRRRRRRRTGRGHNGNQQGGQSNR